MPTLKCKMCGAELEITALEKDALLATCAYCGTKQTIPTVNDAKDESAEKKLRFFNRAIRLLHNCEFDRASGVYESIVTDYPEEAEAYWGLVLCRYGIVYVDDPKTHKRVPTMNRAQFTSIYDDENYRSALEYADLQRRAVYEEEARAINGIQKGILAVSRKEEPFDVFICYKETDENGRRTPDSVLANDLYYQLTKEGFKAFFARITLEDKLGSEYEPCIFAALNSAQVMVVLGTKPEYFNAVWVKNEWSRYLTLVKESGGKKTLIPAYRDMDPYDLPEEFSHLQAQDMSRLGFMQDLIYGIKKLTGKDRLRESESKRTGPAPAVLVTAAAPVGAGSLVERAFLFLEDGDFESAGAYCEKALDLDPKNGTAYLGKLMAEKQISDRASLSEQEEPFDDEPDYQKALRFGDEALQKELSEANARCAERKRIREAEEAARREKLAALSAQMRARIAPAQRMIAAGNEFALLTQCDGTVVPVGTPGRGTDYGQCRVQQDWTDVRAVSASVCNALALRFDGTVLAAGSNRYGQYNVQSWRAIKEVAAGTFHSVGLRYDGLVIAVGRNDKGQCNTFEWRGITAISAGREHTVGLRADGTVVAIGSNRYGQCDVEDWTNVVAISAGDNHTLALRADGTVVAAGSNGSGQCDVEKWEGVTAISAGISHSACVFCDGSAGAVGGNNSGQCDLEEWHGIVAVSARAGYTLGLRYDGTLLAAGDDRFGQCRVEGLRLFGSLDTLERDRLYYAKKRREDYEKRRNEEAADAARRQDGARDDRPSDAERARRRARGLCQHCGAEFTRGYTTVRCSHCGRPKDYIS